LIPLAVNYATLHDTIRKVLLVVALTCTIIGLMSICWTIKADAKDNPPPSFLINQYVDEDGVVIKRICFGGHVIVVACTLKCTGDGASISMLSARQACKK